MCSLLANKINNYHLDMFGNIFDRFELLFQYYFCCRILSPWVSLFVSAWMSELGSQVNEGGVIYPKSRNLDHSDRPASSPKVKEREGSECFLCARRWLSSSSYSSFLLISHLSLFFPTNSCCCIDHHLLPMSELSLVCIYVPDAVVSD